MTRIDENLSVTVYFKETLHSLDGRAWVLTCVASILFILDILIGTNIVPLREVSNPSKAIILLVSSPLLVFCMLVWLRQLPFNGANISTWVRVIFQHGFV